jgi:phosphatidylethanolamine/phosphatidyl-N-methylethanolamine N-methyltransferase
MSAFYQFLKASLKNPMQTSTFVESGPRVGRRFARHLHLRDDQMVVELGVGAGAITEHILDAIKSPKQYAGFELNADLYKFLANEKFPNLEIHHASAETLAETMKGRKVGAVISTLPWSLLPRDVRHNILDQVHEVLEPGGTFSVFLALHCLWTPSVRDFWSTLTEKFPDYTYTDEMWNMPPCRLYFARKH